MKIPREGNLLVKKVPTTANSALFCWTVINLINLKFTDIQNCFNLNYKKKIKLILYQQKTFKFGKIQVSIKQSKNNCCHSQSVIVLIKLCCLFIPKHFGLNLLFVLIKKATIIIIEDSHLEQSQRLRDRTKLENQESSSHANMSKAFLYHKCNTMVLFGIKTSLTSLWYILDYHTNLKTNLEKFIFVQGGL